MFSRPSLEITDSNKNIDNCIFSSLQNQCFILPKSNIEGKKIIMNSRGNSLLT